MTKPITRRDFLKIALTTVSTSVLANADQLQLLPTGVADWPVSPAYPLAIDESGYIYDPTFGYQLPTYREMLQLEDLSEEEQEQQFAQWRLETGYEDEWSGPDIDDEIEPENFSPYQLAQVTEWRTGMDLYESLDQETIERLDLALVEGDSPGAHFTAVKANNPTGLQEALLREGINIEIISGNL
jgi:hypothetical protein